MARLISPTTNVDDAVFVPQDRTTSFKKCATKNPAEIPREVEFEVEGWLERKPEFQNFKPT
jgi:hypothetical protein